MEKVGFLLKSSTESVLEAVCRTGQLTELRNIKVLLHIVETLNDADFRHKKADLIKLIEKEIKISKECLEDYRTATNSSSPVSPRQDSKNLPSA